MILTWKDVWDILDILFLKVMCACACIMHKIFQKDWKKILTMKLAIGMEGEGVTF